VNNAENVVVGGTLVIAGTALTVGAIEIGIQVLPVEYAACAAAESLAACYAFLHTAGVLGSVATTGMMIAGCGVATMVGESCDAWD
jgi:hypothetical protein